MISTETLTPRALADKEPVRGIEPPPFKFFYHRCRARSGYDTRTGIMRVCAWTYLVWPNTLASLESGQVGAKP
jgi:phage gp29-like protein